MEWLNKPTTRDNMDACYDYSCGKYNPDNLCLIRFCASRGSCSFNNCVFYFG